LALIPTPSALDGLEALQNRLIPHFPHGTLRWTSRENLHVTLQFLGGTLRSQKMVTEASAALSRAASSCPPWTLTAQNLGVFPSHSKPRVLWIGLTESQPRLKLLRERFVEELRSAVGDVELEFDRTEIKHLTLGRWNDLYVKKNEADRVLSLSREFAEVQISWTVKDILLLHSDMSEYTPLHVAPLQSESPLEPRRRRSR
jgi:2'-5' RNA ligase